MKQFGGHHFLGDLKKAGSIDVFFNVIPNLSSLYLTLWKDFVDTFEIEIIAPNGISSGTIFSNQSFQTINIQQTTIHIFNSGPVHYHVDQEIFFLFDSQNTSIAEGIWIIRITRKTIVDGSFHIWLPTTEEVSNQTAFLVPEISTTITLPSTAKNVITIGGYQSRIGTVTDFSGRGYTRKNVYTKPDLLAPAVGILTTAVGGGYDSFTGTSVAAPFVTGSIALMMEWGIVNQNDPYLYGQRVKGFLRKGAKRNSNISYPNNRWGYGSLCLKNTMEYLVSYVKGGV